MSVVNILPHLLHPAPFCCWNIWKLQMSDVPSSYFHMSTLRTATFSYMSLMLCSHLRNPLIQCNVTHSSYSHFSNCLSMILCRFSPHGFINIYSAYLVIMFLYFLWSKTVSSSFVVIILTILMSSDQLFCKTRHNLDLYVSSILDSSKIFWARTLPRWSVNFYCVMLGGSWYQLLSCW